MRYFIQFLVICLAYGASSQNNQRDSLWEIHVKTQDDSLKIETLVEIGQNFLYSNPDSTLFYYEEAIRLAKKLRKERILRNFDIEMGIAYRYKRDYKKALEYYLRGLDVAIKESDTVSIASCYNNMGNLYMEQGEYNKSLENFLKSADFHKNGPKTTFLARTYYNIGMVHEKLNNSERSIEFTKMAMDIAVALKDDFLIGMCKNQLGISSKDAGRYDEALAYYNDALQYFIKIGNWSMASMVYSNLGILYEKMGDYEKALEEHLRSLKIKEEIGDSYRLAITYGNLASIYQELGNMQSSDKKKQEYFNTGLSFAEKALNLARDKGYLYIESGVYEIYAGLYSGTGRHKDALEAYILFKSTADSIFNQDKNRQIEEMDAKYENEKKQLEIEKLEQEQIADQKVIEAEQEKIRKQRVIILSSVTGLVLVISLLFIVLRMFREKKKANLLLEQKNREIASQNEEITAQRDEISAQRDKLNETLNELQRTQDQLIESEKIASLGTLVTGMAHEINTPVGIGITASTTLIEDTQVFAEKLRKSELSKSELKEFLESVYRSGNLIYKNMIRTGDLVSTFKQISTDQQSEVRQKFNIFSFLNDFIPTHKTELEKVNAAIIVNCSSSLEIDSFPGAFAQIISIMISNSVKHGFSGKSNGQIEIEVKQTEAGIRLYFRDDGNGIPEENLHHLFEPFFTTNKQLGSGLGLHIAYNIALQKFGSTIEVRSEVNNGAEFSFTLS